MKLNKKVIDSITVCGLCAMLTVTAVTNSGRSEVKAEDKVLANTGLEHTGYNSYAGVAATLFDYEKGLTAENAVTVEKENVEMVAAAQDAQAVEFIEEKGLDTMLAIRGMDLSGGQKQRLLITRALVKHPQILVLDDSSSALDYATDARLRKAIQENYGDLTSIIVAQRISSIYRADKIIVLEDGEMIGYGTHKNLMESCEVYREISQSQMGGGIDEA